MPRVTVFADESGNLDFSRRKGASRYFVLTTVTCAGFAVGNALLGLRRQLGWDGIGDEIEIHATTNPQAVRDRVFELLDGHDFRVDSTIFEKSKAAPHTRPTEERFYKLAWYLHFKYVAPQIVDEGDELFVVGASLGVRKKRSLMHAAIRDVVQQVSPTVDFRTASWSATSEPCLQVADYCCWAIARKWELADPRSYDLIAGKIASEYEVFRLGRKHYY